MNGMIVPSVSAGSSHRAARETCTPQVMTPSGAAWSGRAPASSRNAIATSARAWLAKTVKLGRVAPNAGAHALRDMRGRHPLENQVGPRALPRGILHDPGRAVPELLVDAPHPQITGLVHVRIGGDQLQLSHDRPPRRCGAAVARSVFLDGYLLWAPGRSRLCGSIRAAKVAPTGAAGKWPDGRRLPSLAAAKLLEIRARPGVLFQERLDPADLFLVAGQRPPVARVEKIQNRQRGFRVAPLRILQLGKHYRAQLGPRRRVPRLHLLYLGDRSPAGFPQLRIARGLGRILASQSLDERAIALVVRSLVAFLREAIEC